MNDPIVSITFTREVIREASVNGSSVLDVVCYAMALDPPRYPMPAIIYTPDFESATLWEYKGYPDDIKSRYPTYYKRVR